MKRVVRLAFGLSMLMQMRPSLGVAAVGAWFSIPAASWAQTLRDADIYPCGPHMMWWSGGWFGMLLGPLFMVAILVATIVVTVILVRRIGGSGGADASSEPRPVRTPLDILKERFARGEIDKDEFEERQRALGE